MGLVVFTVYYLRLFCYPMSSIAMSWRHLYLTSRKQHWNQLHWTLVTATSFKKVVVCMFVHLCFYVSLSVWTKHPKNVWTDSAEICHADVLQANEEMIKFYVSPQYMSSSKISPCTYSWPLCRFELSQHCNTIPTVTTRWICFSHLFL